MRKPVLTDIILLKTKDKKHKKKNLIVNLLELIQVKVMMKLVEYKHLLVRKLEKESNKEIKDLEDKIKKK